MTTERFEVSEFTPPKLTEREISKRLENNPLRHFLKRRNKHDSARIVSRENLGQELKTPGKTKGGDQS